MASSAELGATETAPDLAGSVVTGAGAPRPYARFVSAVLLPIVLFLVTRALERLL